MVENPSKIETQNVSCLLCSQGSELPGIFVKDYLTQHSDAIYEYRKCDCGLIYLRNQPLQSQIHKLYQFSYGAYSSDKGLVSILRDKRSQNLHRKVSKFSTKKNIGVLDFGCGSGNFLKAITPYAENLVGFEFQFNPELESKSEILKVYKVNDLKKIDKVQFIYMFQVIEHLADPSKILKVLNEIADDKAKLVIETPIYAGWILRFFPKDYWGGWHAPRHFSIFSEGTLEQVLAMNGWQIYSKKYIPSPYQWIESLRPVFRNIGFSEKFLKLNNSLLVTFFYTLDLVSLLLGRKTSNIQIIATKSKTTS